MASNITRIEDIPHDELYVHLWGEGYREHAEFLRHMEHVVSGSRQLRHVKDDLREAHEFRAPHTKPVTPMKGW